MTQHFNKAIEHFGQVASSLQIVPKGVRFEGKPVRSWLNPSREEREAEEFFSQLMQDAQQFCDLATTARAAYGGRMDTPLVTEPGQMYKDLRKFHEANNFYYDYTISDTNMRYLSAFGIPASQYDPYNWKW